MNKRVSRTLKTGESSSTVTLTLYLLFLALLPPTPMPFYHQTKVIPNIGFPFLTSYCVWPLPNQVRLKYEFILFAVHVRPPATLSSLPPPTRSNYNTPLTFIRLSFCPTTQLSTYTHRHTCYCVCMDATLSYT